MKWARHTGLYFMIFAIGCSMLNFIEASDVYFYMFMAGNCLYCFGNLWSKDS